MVSTAYLGEGDHFVVEDNPSTQSVVLRNVKPPGEWFDAYMDPGLFGVGASAEAFLSPQA
jgi:hypothetical protein